MREILLYWNHICILQKKEKDHLEQVAKKLLEQDIKLTVRFFGLGYPMHMSDYLAKEDAKIPDFIVSADLEVFENERIYSKFSSKLHQVSDFMELKNIPITKSVKRDEFLLPFVSIPLVYYTKSPKEVEGTNIEDIESLAFGGINNSAGKTITKTLWELKGKDVADKVLSKTQVYDMPIGGFSAVKKGKAKTALVPSIYALSADSETSFLVTPKEGPVMIPSYFCAGTSVPRDIAKMIANEIITSELCDFYAKRGDLIVFPDKTQIKSGQEGNKYILPSINWLKNVSSQDFYQLYKKHLPTAIEPM